jgi:hypothetical protein
VISEDRIFFIPGPPTLFKEKYLGYKGNRATPNHMKYNTEPVTEYVDLRLDNPIFIILNCREHGIE